MRDSGFEARPRVRRTPSSRKVSCRSSERAAANTYAQRLTSGWPAVVKKLTTPVLNVAVSRAQGPTRRGHGRACDAADDGTDRPANDGSGNHACGGASCLLRRLTGGSRKADSGCKEELLIACPSRPATLRPSM